MGATNGTYRVRAKVALSDDSQTFSGPFKTEILMLDGTSITANGTVTAKRIRVEPL